MTAPHRERSLKWLPLLVAGAIAFASGCASSTRDIATSSTHITELTSRALQGLDAAALAFIRPEDAPPPSPEEVAAGQKGLKSAAQSVRDIAVANARIVQALPGVKDTEPAFLSLIRLGLWTLLTLALLVGSWYLGVGALIGRLVRLIASLIPQIIPRKIEAQAKLDAEALIQTRKAAQSSQDPNAAAAADTLSSNIAIRRTQSPLYEAAFNRYHKG